MLLGSVINKILVQYSDYVAPKDATKISMGLQQFMLDQELYNLSPRRLWQIEVNDNYVAELPPDMNLYGSLWIFVCYAGQLFTIDITDKLCPKVDNCKSCLCDSCETTCNDGCLACCDSCGGVVGYQLGGSYWNNGTQWGFSYDGAPVTPIANINPVNPFGQVQRDNYSKYLQFSSLVGNCPIFVRGEVNDNIASIELPDATETAAMMFPLWKIALGRGDRVMAQEFEHNYNREAYKLMTKEWRNVVNPDLAIKAYYQNYGLVLQNKA